MYSRLGRSCWIKVMLAVAVIVPPAMAQDPISIPAFRPRQFAPGVLTVIPKAAEGGDTFSGPTPLVEITVGMPDLNWTPNFEPKTKTVFERAKSVTLYRPVWCLEFAFKPLRMIEVDVPQPSGRTQRKRIWYLVYRVKNVGYDVNPALEEELPGLKTATLEDVNYATRRFIPHFVLESLEFDKEYLDRIIPAARPAIQARENPGSELYNSVEMASVQIPLSDDRIDRSVWGFVTWEDVDPRIDFFSVYVRGLTNAFQFVDPPGAFQPGNPPGTGRQFAFRTLRLNFWRRGDTHYEHEKEISFGVPVDSEPDHQQGYLEKYGLERRLDYLWIYR